MLVAQAAMLVLRAVNAQVTTTDDVIAKCLESVGKVCVQGKECEGVGAVAAATGGGGARSDEDIVDKTCNTCHDTGLLGVSRADDKVEWGKHAKEQGGLDGLLVKAISGISATPPEGVCTDCSDDELKTVIKHMSDL